MPVRVIARFSLYYLVALLAVAVCGAFIELPPGVSVVLAPFVAAFLAAPIHARATGRSLKRVENILVTVALSITSVAVSCSALACFLVFYYLLNTGSVAQEINNILSDRDGWYAALAFVYIVFIVVLAPFIAVVYKFSYERALRKIGDGR